MGRSKSPLPDGVPANWSAWRLSSKEQAKDFVKNRVTDYPPCLTGGPAGPGCANLFGVPERESPRKAGGLCVFFLLFDLSLTSRLTCQPQFHQSGGRGRSQEAVGERTQTKQSKTSGREETKDNPGNRKWSYPCRSSRTSTCAGKSCRSKTSPIVDPSNVEYYTAVQEDVRVILKALGSGFGQLDPLPIAEKDKEGTGGVQARTLSLLNGTISSCVFLSCMMSGTL